MRKSVIIIFSILLIFILGVSLLRLRPKQTNTPHISSIDSISPILFSTSTPYPANHQVVPTLSPSPVVQKTTTAESVHLSVPFTAQAPDADWSEPWAEGCEEAALLMSDAFNDGDNRETLPATETKEKIKQMVDWQLARFGGHKDLGIDAMAVMAKDYFGYTKVTIIHDASFDDIKTALRRGKPVIIPAAGQKLGNPYFKQPGPLYHVFVLTGFEGDIFIANENGTKRGKDYTYTKQVLDAAWHDKRPDMAIDVSPRSLLILEN